MKLDNRNVLITGASSGLGAEYAQQLHSRGCKVTLVARRRDLLVKLCEELNAKRADSASFIVADLTTSSGSVTLGLLDLCEQIARSSYDIIINNAGFGSFGRIHQLPFEHERNMVLLNSVAPIALTQAALPGMKQRKLGAVVNISSIAGYQPLPYMATYGATKAFLNSFSIAVRNELKGSGVSVISICPGPTATEFGGVARIPGQMTGTPRDSAETIVRNSLRAIERGQAFSFPSARSFLLSILPRILPTTLTTWITEKMLKPTLLIARGDDV